MHLSRLVDQAVKGKTLNIAKGAKTLVKSTALDAPVTGRVKRVGFMEGQGGVPDDFDRVGDAEIAQMFGGEPG